MTEENKKETALISIGSTDLVKLGNSIALTNKLLRESKFEFLNDFKGTLISTFPISNVSSYYFEFFDENTNKIIFLQGDGIIKLFDPKKETSEETSTLKEYLDNSSKTIWSNNYERILTASLFEGQLFIIPKNHNLIVFNLSENIIKEATFPINKELHGNYFVQWADCKALYNIDSNKILLYVIEGHNYGTTENASMDYVHYFQMLNAFDLSEDKIINTLDSSCNDVIYNSDFIYFTSKVRNGEIIKQNIKDNTVSTIKLFERRIYFIDFIADKSKLICSDLLQVAILDINSLEILKIIDVGKEIMLIRVSTCGKYFGLQTENFELLIFDTIKYLLIKTIALSTEDNILELFFFINFPLIYTGNWTVINTYN